MLMYGITRTKPTKNLHKPIWNVRAQCEFVHTKFQFAPQKKRYNWRTKYTSRRSSTLCARYVYIVATIDSFYPLSRLAIVSCSGLRKYSMQY